jgi:hypothetical protein
MRRPYRDSPYIMDLINNARFCRCAARWLSTRARSSTGRCLVGAAVYTIIGAIIISNGGIGPLCSPSSPRSLLAGRRRPGLLHLDRRRDPGDRISKLRNLDSYFGISTVTFENKRLNMIGGPGEAVELCCEVTVGYGPTGGGPLARVIEKLFSQRFLIKLGFSITLFNHSSTAIVQGRPKMRDLDNPRLWVQIPIRALKLLAQPRTIFV